MGLVTCGFVFVVFYVNEILADCGRPGYSKNSIVVDGKHRYAEGKWVRYACKSAASSIIYGYIERKCDNNQWLYSIPKCATKISSAKVKKYVRNEVIVVSTNTAAKLVGIRLKVSARVDIQVDEVKHLPEYNCTRTLGPQKDNYLDRNYVFTCVTLIVDTIDYKINNFIIVKFTHSLECPQTCKANVDQFELFAVGKDDCYVPDRPDYGSTRMVKVSDSGEDQSEVRHEFNCNPDFQMRTTKITSDYCRKEGDWQYPPLPQCIPISTCKLPELPENVIVDYTDLFQRNRYVVGGLIKYSCPEGDVLGGSPSQECLSDGTWTGTKPRCIPKPNDVTTNRLLFALVAALVGVPLLLVVLVILLSFISRKQIRDEFNQSSSSKYASMEFKAKNRELPKQPDYLDLIDPRYSVLERGDIHLYDDIDLNDPNYEYIQPQPKVANDTTRSTQNNA